MPGGGRAPDADQWVHVFLAVRFRRLPGNSSSRTASTPYRNIHWHAPESGYGHSCPGGHGQGLDPHWPPRAAGNAVTVPTQVSDVNRGEPACRPGSVRPLARGGGHPSGTAVADSLVRSTRGLRRAAFKRPRRHNIASATSRPPDLAPGGVYRAAAVTCGAGGLLHHRFTLTPADAGAV